MHLKNYCCARGGSWSRFGPRASIGEDALPVAFDAMNCSISYQPSCCWTSLRWRQVAWLHLEDLFPLNGWFDLCIAVVLWAYLQFYCLKYLVAVQYGNLWYCKLLWVPTYLFRMPWPSSLSWPSCLIIVGCLSFAPWLASLVVPWASILALFGHLLCVCQG